MENINAYSECEYNFWSDKRSDNFDNKKKQKKKMLLQCYLEYYEQILYALTKGEFDFCDIKKTGGRIHRPFLI